MAPGTRDAWLQLEAALADLGETEFLHGPDHEAEDLDIDPIFATRWEVVLDDAILSLGLQQADRGQLISWCRHLASEALLETADDNVLMCLAEDAAGLDCGIVAISTLSEEPVVIGLYIGCQLGVADDWRGRGIAAHLVKHRFLRDRELPTWSLDTPAYSPGGQAAHVAGYRLLHAHLENLRDPDAEISPCM